MVFNEQAFAGGNAEHSTHQSPGAFLGSKLHGQADDKVDAVSLSNPGGGTQKYFMAARQCLRHPPCFCLQGC